MIINVTEVTPAPGSTVWEGTGTTEDGTQVITFAGDWRAMQHLMDMVDDGYDGPVEIEGWQILSREEKH